MVLSDDYKPPIRFALIQQSVVAVLCLLLLDGGAMAKHCAIVMLAFWSAVAIVMIRHPQSPTDADKLLIRFAFIPLFVVSVVIAQ